MTTGAANAAVTVLSCVSVSWQVAPLHAPLKPVKLPPPLAVALSVTAVPEAKLAWQVPLATPDVTVQLIPPGVLVTVPEPPPEPVTVSTGCSAKFATSTRFALAVKP